MDKKCNEKACEACGDFKIKVVEEFSEEKVDTKTITRIADYLGWKKTEDNKFGKIFISREKFPRLRVVFQIEDTEKRTGGLLIFLMKSKTRYWVIVSMSKSKRVNFSEKQKIKKGIVVDQVRRVEIFGRGGASIILTNHEFYGFLAAEI